MKKLIQICSVLCLVLTFSFISAHAQTTKKIKADIPFDFNVGGNHYNAGSYTLRLADSRPGAAIYLIDSDNKIIDTLLVANVVEAAAGESTLTFNNYDGQRFLSNITTRGGSYRTIRTKVERQVAAGKRPVEKKPVLVAIATAN